MKALFSTLLLFVMACAYTQVIDQAQTLKSSELYSNGSLSLEFKKYEQAKSYFQEAISLYQGNADYFYGLGLAQFKLDELDASLFTIRKAIAMDDQQANFHYQEGAVLYALSSFDNARRSFEKAIELNTSSDLKIDIDNAFFQIGVCYMKTDKYHEAIKVFNKIIAEKPTYEKALINRGIALAYLEHFDKACDDFSQAANYNYDRARTMLEQYCNNYRNVVVRN
ncbi:MAG: tetratricopeptide repeat protein [Marinoscillum sp.]